MDHSTRHSSKTSFGEFASDEHTSGVYPSQNPAPADDALDDAERDEVVLLPVEPRALPNSMQGVVGLADSLIDVYRVIDRVADAQCTILITGESGAGNAGSSIEPKDLPQRVCGLGTEKRITPRLPDTGIDLRTTVESFENQLICQALERTKWNKKQAATLLGLNRTTLVEMLKRKRIGPRAA